MAKLPDYRLQTLFSLRERAKKDAEDAYAEAQRLVNDEQRKLDEMKAELAAKVEYREKKKQEYSEKAARGELNIHAITSSERHVDRLKEEEAAYEVEIDKQREQLQEAEQELEKKREEMLKANQEFKALEKHKENWTQQVKHERQIKEEDAAEEIAQSLFLRKSRSE